MNAMDIEYRRIKEIKSLMNQGVTCPIHRRRLKNEMRKLTRRHYRIKKALIPSPSMVLIYRGTTFFFKSHIGNECTIRVDHDNIETRYQNGTTHHSTVPTKDARKWLKYGIDHIYYDDEVREELTPEEQQAREMRQEARDAMED